MTSCIGMQMGPFLIVFLWGLGQWNCVYGSICETSSYLVCIPLNFLSDHLCRFALYSFPR